MNFFFRFEVMKTFQMCLAIRYCQTCIWLTSWRTNWSFWKYSSKYVLWIDRSVLRAKICLVFFNFPKEKFIRNLIGYLCDSASRKTLYFDLFRDLVCTWSTQQSIANTPIEQHLYLTKMIIVCLSFADDDDKARISNGTFSWFYPTTSISSLFLFQFQ